MSNIVTYDFISHFNGAAVNLFGSSLVGNYRLRSTTVSLEPTEQTFIIVISRSILDITGKLRDTRHKARG
ncbi:hypothetical protein [Paenibacillus qinlingensis]|uniref:hypothetical protein n=1 Tax=Paenibacillus qinlingensis TaxID=1837343 RepID=UPI00286E2B92|nr:hypothetical protein [Paenibacillus qinlingensis]